MPIPGSEKITAPIAMQMIGSDSGSLRSASGSHATSAISSPAPVSQRMYGSGEEKDGIGDETNERRIVAAANCR